MRASLILFACSIAVVIASPARALSLAEYWRNDFDHQRTYLLGVHEGFLQVALTTDDSPPRERIRNCLSGLKTDADLATAFAVWVQAHPEMMSENVPVVYVQYLFNVCPAAKGAKR